MAPGRLSRWRSSGASVRCSVRCSSCARRLTTCNARRRRPRSAGRQIARIVAWCGGARPHLAGPSRHGAELAQSVPGERVRPWQADLGHRRHLHAHAGQGLQRAAMGRLVGPRSSSAPCERALCAPFAVHDVDAYTICARSPARTHAIARILLRGVATSSAAHSSSTARSASRASSATSTATACTLAPCAGTVPSVAETCPMQVSPGRNVRTERKRADGRAWNNASAEKNA